MSTPVTVSMDGLLINWLKKAGETVSKGEVVAEIEADKATVEIEAPESGVLADVTAQPGDTLTAGAVIAAIASGAAESAPAAAPASSPAPAPAAESAPARAPRTNGAPPPQAMTDTGRIKASPLARRIAGERGIDLNQVRGSGPGGRIVREDVENFTPGAAPTAPAPAAAPASAPASAPAALIAPARKMPEGPDIEVIELATMRRRIAAVTVESKQFTPHFYVTMEMDAAPLVALRAQLNGSLPEGAPKITVNDMLVKAAALTLRQFPNLNSHFYGDRLARHRRINIGIAVALPDGGLINVVARDADRMALGALAASNKEMIARAREGKVKPEDISGATFTISNLGPYDVDHFVAIINPPEAGILAIGAAKSVPVVLPDGTLGIGTRMKVTISVDHRVSDGAEGADYLRTFKAMVENPLRLLV